MVVGLARLILGDLDVHAANVQKKTTKKPASQLKTANFVHYIFEFLKTKPSIHAGLRGGEWGEVSKSGLTAQLVALSARQAHISLSGGSTPQGWFRMLAQSAHAAAVRWENLHFWWGDERCVPPDDEESNFGTAQRLLLAHVPLPPGNIHRIRGEDRPETEVLRYAAEIRQYVPVGATGLPSFDWVLLGMGDDGHTASLFPGQTDFAEPELTVLVQHPVSGQNRISKSAALLMAGQRVDYLVTGAGKAALLRDIREMDKNPAARAQSPWPAARIFSLHGESNWYLDPSAASLILKSSPQRREGTKIAKETKACEPLLAHPKGE